MNIIIGKKVVNKLRQTGIIVSVDDKYFYVDYGNRVAKLPLDAFEKGFLKYEDADLQDKIDRELAQIENEKMQKKEELLLPYKRTEAVRKEIESKSPVGVRVDSASVQLEPAPLSFSLVKNKDQELLQEIFADCDNSIKAHYDAFEHKMKYIRIPYYSRTAMSRYSEGFLSKYSNAYVFRVFSRNDVYEEGRVGNVVVTNSDTTEIIRIVCIEGRLYKFSKHISCAGASARYSTVRSKWQASDAAAYVNLNKIVRNCDCKYLNDYIEATEVNCLQYVKLMLAALYSNKAEIVFKHKLFSSTVHIENIVEYLEEFTSKQIDFASKNNVINTLPIIKRCGLHDIDILQKLESVMKKRRTGDSIYTSLVQIFNHFNLDASVLDTKLINFLRRPGIFNANLYGDYIDLLAQTPAVTVDDLFDKDYIERHDVMVQEKALRVSVNEINQYARAEQELSWINREENGYFIIVPKTISDFKHEGALQHNCVYTNRYFRNVISHYSIIVFLRKEKNVPYVTIEYDYETFEVVQALGKYNRRIDRDLYRYIEYLGKTLYRERASQ